MEHGRSIGGLAPSSYEATLDFNLASGYPIGVFLPLGVARALVGQDVAWVFQPYMALLAAMLSLCLYSLARPLLRSRPMRALAAFVAAQAALLFGYSLWGGIKEVAAAALVALVAALAPEAARPRVGVRGSVPAAIAVAALIAALSVPGAVWALPALTLALALAVRELGPRPAAVRGVAFAAVTAAASIPVFAAGGALPPTSSPLTSDTARGNLVEPLSWLQFFGVWPVGDFRFRPENMDTTYVLVAVVALAGLVGLAWAIQRRAWPFAGFVATATLGCLVIAGLGSPWVDGKALAIASPAFVFAALVAAAMALEGGRRVEAALVAAAVTAGVVWSNALAYQDANLAPRERLVELEHIGERIAGEGPTLSTDYEPYEVRHFLRESDPQGASELRRSQIPLRSGLPLAKLGYADMDEFQLQGLLEFRTMVLRRTPVSSRPPSPYRLVESGRWYDVWQRPESGFPAVAEHLPLGSRLAPTARPSCAAVERLARMAGPGGRLVAAVRPPPILLDATAADRPVDWRAGPRGSAAVVPAGAGRLAGTVRLRHGGRYEVWVGGSFRRLVDVTAGRRPFRDRNQLNHAGQWVPLGTADLEPGDTPMALTYHDADLHAGSGGPPFALGPLALTPENARSRLLQVSPRRARSLCGRRLDWIEAVRPGRSVP
jgi:hypothetical protein